MYELSTFGTNPNPATSARLGEHLELTALENFRRGGEAETVTTCERTLWPLEKPQRKEGGAGRESDYEEDAAAKRHQSTNVCV